MGLVALTLGAAATLEAQDPDLSDFHRFQLLTRCEEVLLSSVSVSGDTAEEIGLTEERVRAMAEGRLRVARLLSDDPWTEALGPRFFGGQLMVSVATLDTGPAYAIRLEFVRRLYSPATELTDRAITWSGGGFGIHGGDADFIMQQLSEYLDEFILEYLRVNEGWCL